MVFGLGGTEIALIIIVALLIIGPKNLAKVKPFLKSMYKTYLKLQAEADTAREEIIDVEQEVRSQIDEVKTQAEEEFGKDIRSATKEAQEEIKKEKDILEKEMAEEKKQFEKDIEKEKIKAEDEFEKETGRKVKRPAAKPVPAARQGAGPARSFQRGLRGTAKLGASSSAVAAAQARPAPAQKKAAASRTKPSAKRSGAGKGR